MLAIKLFTGKNMNNNSKDDRCIKKKTKTTKKKKSQMSNGMTKGKKFMPDSLTAISIPNGPKIRFPRVSPIVRK